MISFTIIEENESFKLFITTDLEEVATEAQQEFGNETVITSDGPYTHIDREKQSKSCDRVKKTFVDLHFMQNCDRIVISNSNFGKFGVLLRPQPAREAFIFKQNQFFAIDENLSFESQ